MSGHAVAVERVRINQVGDCLEANAGELTSISINYLNNIWWERGMCRRARLGPGGLVKGSMNSFAGRFRCLSAPTAGIRLAAYRSRGFSQDRLD